MPIAYQEQAQLTCPACGADFEAPVWLILDAQEQPEAADALRGVDVVPARRVELEALAAFAVQRTA